MRTKLMAAAAVTVAALGLTGGALVLATAAAQPGPGGGAGGGGPFLVGGFAPQPGGDGRPGGPGGGAPGAGGPGGGATSGWATGPTPFEYRFVDVRGDRAEFEKAVTQLGRDGWEFCGSERLATTKGMDLVLVFKKRGSAAVAGLPGGPPPGPGRAGGAEGSSRPPAEAAPGKSLTVFQLKGAKAEETATVLKPLFPNTEMSADPRTNAVIARGDERALDEIRLLIARLEAAEPVRPPPPAGGSGR